MKNDVISPVFTLALSSSELASARLGHCFFMGTSTCFYNSLSRRQNETGLIGFYMRVTAVVFAIILLAALLLQIPVAGELLMAVEICASSW